MGVTTYARTIANVSVNTGVDGTASVCVVALVAAVGLFEIQRRAALGVRTLSPWNVASSLRSAKSYKRVLIQCIPEVLGIVACLGVVACFLWRPRTFGSPEDKEMWEQIRAEWPRLLCADTLLAIQSMLRLASIAAAVFHRAGPVPLQAESAALLGLACLARTVVGACSAPYLLDGPLGTNFPVACDVVSMMLAFSLGKTCFWKRPLPTICTAIALTWLSSRHCLNLSGGKPHLDALFIASFGFDSLAAFTHLFHSLSIGSLAAALPRQAIFATQGIIGAYYFHYGLPSSQDIVLVGKPLEFLQAVHMAAAAACLGAMALFIFDDTPGDVGRDGAAPVGVFAGTEHQGGAWVDDVRVAAAGACAVVPTGAVLW